MVYLGKRFRVPKKIFRPSPGLEPSHAFFLGHLHSHPRTSFKDELNSVRELFIDQNCDKDSIVPRVLVCGQGGHPLASFEFKSILFGFP